VGWGFWYCGHQWPIVPAPGDYDDGEICGMIGRGNRSTRRKPAPLPLCPPQTPHAARTRTRTAAVGSQRLTAFATATAFALLTMGSDGLRAERPGFDSRQDVSLRSVETDSGAHQVSYPMGTGGFFDGYKATGA
jgi:hypothetical protein